MHDVWLRTLSYRAVPPAGVEGCDGVIYPTLVHNMKAGFMDHGGGAKGITEIENYSPNIASNIDSYYRFFEAVRC